MYICMESEKVYNIGLLLGVTYICYICMESEKEYENICILFQILYRLLQNNEDGSLCYTVDLVSYLFYIE